MRAITPMKDDLARKIRATAASVDKTHPETVAAQHLRNAATLVQHGQGDGAKRHLDAAMELMTPRNLMRHGITDDEGHATAKTAMHQMNVHRLSVMDIQDAQARNSKEADAKKQASDQQVQAKQAAAAAKQQPTTPPPPASGQQNAGSSPPGKQPPGQQGQQASSASNTWPTPILAQSFSNVDLSARTAALEVTPAPYGKPGGPGLYGKAGNKHSDYFEQIVTALMTKRGMDKATASKIAWGALRKWRAGGGSVHPEVRAAAAGALVKEAAAGARAALSSDWDAIDQLIDLASSGGHHIPGTSYDWRHTYIPLTSSAAQSHFRGHVPASWHPSSGSLSTGKGAGEDHGMHYLHTTDSGGGEHYHVIHGSSTTDLAREHFAEVGVKMREGEQPPIDQMPKAARKFYDHALANGWNVTYSPAKDRQGMVGVHGIDASNPETRQNVGQAWDQQGKHYQRGMEPVRASMATISASPRASMIQAPKTPFEADAARFDKAFRDAGAIKTAPDGSQFIDHSKVSPDLLRSYRNFISYGYATGKMPGPATQATIQSATPLSDQIELSWKDAWKTEDRGKGGQWVGELSGAVRDLAGKTGNSEADDHLRKAADAIGAQDKATAQQHLKAADDLISASMRGHGMATDAEHRQGNAALMRIRQHMRGTGDLPDTKPAQLSGGWDAIDHLIDLAAAQQGGSNARSQNAKNQARVPKGQPGGGQFGTGGKGKAGKAGKGSGSHAAQKHALLAKAATIRGQIKALAAQIKSANSTAAKSPAAAAAAAKSAASTAAAAPASTAAPAASSTTTAKAASTPTVAQMTTQMTALRGQLAKVMAQIHQLG